MRKKDILGNFVKIPGVLYEYEIKKLDGEDEAYSALITFLPGIKELLTEYDGKQVCLAGFGYKLIVYLPLNECFCIVASYSPRGEWLEWYFDISARNFLDESGMPCIDDIFLDLIVLPTGKTITLDADELREALAQGEIAVDDFNHAYNVHDQIKDSKWSDVDYLKELSEELLSGYGLIPASYTENR